MFYRFLRSCCNIKTGNRRARLPLALQITSFIKKFLSFMLHRSVLRLQNSFQSAAHSKAQIKKARQVTAFKPLLKAYENFNLSRLHGCDAHPETVSRRAGQNRLPNSLIVHLPTRSPQLPADRGGASRSFIRPRRNDGDGGKPIRCCLYPASRPNHAHYRC